jgi:phytoene dehydrogenase-like protein
MMKQVTVIYLPMLWQKLAQDLGVEFKFDQNVEKLIVEGDEIKGVVVNGAILTADRYVWHLVVIHVIFLNRCN